MVDYDPRPNLLADMQALRDTLIRWKADLPEASDT